MFPFWHPQMDIDIKKPAPVNSPINARPMSSLRQKSMGEINFSSTIWDGKRPDTIVRRDTNDVTEKDDVDVVIHRSDAKRNAALPIPANPNRYVLHNGMNKSTYTLAPTDEIKEKEKPKSMLMRTGIMDNWISKDLDDEGKEKKRIVLPVRVEPKVFFANERTFLAWLHFLIILGALALGLLNFGDKFSKISGVVLTVIAMFFMFYALYMYLWRAHKIRQRCIFN
jgi:Domain of unknown function (DUF202)